VVALTFDDGPSPYTAGVVNVLVRMHVPATFFVVGTSSWATSRRASGTSSGTDS